MNIKTKNLIFTLLFISIFGVREVKAEFVFGEPVNLTSTIPILDPEHDFINFLSYDGLEIYVESNRPGSSGVCDIWVFKRASINDDWSPPENLGPIVNSESIDNGSSVSMDGLTLYLQSTRDGGYGNGDIYMTTRTNRNEQWGPVVNLGATINSPRGEGATYISSNSLELYFNSWRYGGYGGGDLYVSKRDTTNDPWGEPENLGPRVNSEYDDVNPCISPDGLILFFSGSHFATTHRPGGYGGADIWMTRRANHSAPWEAVVNLGSPVNGPVHDIIPRLSWDGSKLYYHEFSGNSWDNWQLQIIPTCDFNGDGQSDGKDVLCMASHWETDDPLCDIGPFAWGDGIVGLQDVIVLADYLGKEVIDPTLIAHWALDETEGNAAKDSVSGEDAFVMGEAVWQPDGGMVGGALELDGIDDCIIISSAWNPSDGPFSVLAWIKGGAPGQVVISHSEGFNGDNLLIMGAEGKLMTELGSSTGAVSALLSETIITDGIWHRIGLVWDSSYRYLYVDGEEVARDDTSFSLESGEGGMYIGAGNGIEPGSLWSGLIDDVRIYDRVVSP